MKYILLILSIILIVYPIYGIIKCITALGNLTNYGAGVLVGGIVILLIGLLLLYFSIKLLKKEKVK